MILDFKNWVMTEATHSFSCVMATLDSKSIVDWAKKHIKEEDFYEPEGGLEEESHVTVLYGLHTSKPDEVKKILKNIKPFRIRLGKISKFEAAEYDVLKIEVEGVVLRKLNKEFKKLPYTSKFPTYIPHCTLAYVKKGTCKDLVGNRDFSGKSINIKEIVFSSSTREKTIIELD